MGKKVKIIITDDNRNFCQMLQNYIQSQENFSIVGIANNGLEAWERSHTETIKRISGYFMNIERQKPTNSEFIALLFDKFRVMGRVS